MIPFLRLQVNEERRESRIEIRRIENGEEGTRQPGNQGIEIRE
jgi:hypothetical protein